MEITFPSRIGSTPQYSRYHVVRHVGSNTKYTVTYIGVITPIYVTYIGVITPIYVTVLTVTVEIFLTVPVYIFFRLVELAPLSFMLFSI